MCQYSRIINSLIFISLAVFLAGCGNNARPQREKAKEGRLLAVINNYKMSVGDFYRDVRPILKNKLLTEDPRKEKRQILEELIQKEILIQEAQRLNLDKEKDFMREIEQYWKQALIKSLILKKQNEFAGEEQMDNWISELRKAAAVKIDDEALNTISLDSDYKQGGR